MKIQEQMENKAIDVEYSKSCKVISLSFYISGETTKL